MIDIITVECVEAIAATEELCTSVVSGNVLITIYFVLQSILVIVKSGLYIEFTVPTPTNIALTARQMLLIYILRFGKLYIAHSWEYVVSCVYSTRSLHMGQYRDNPYAVKH